MRPLFPVSLCHRAHLKSIISSMTTSALTPHVMFLEANRLLVFALFPMTVIKSSEQQNAAGFYSCEVTNLLYTVKYLWSLFRHNQICPYTWERLCFPHFITFQGIFVVNAGLKCLYYLYFASEWLKTLWTTDFQSFWLHLLPISACDTLSMTVRYVGK